MPAAPKVKMPRAKADKIVKKVEKHLKPFVDRQMACGSYRRGAQLIGDIDFVVIPKEGVTLPQMLPPNDGINWLGDNKAQVIIDGEKVDFKVTTPEAWGATILYFTGPADFNIKYRWMAKKRGMKLNEYGLWDRKTDAYIAGATEQDIYDAMKRPYRDPDQRTGWKRAEYQPNQQLSDYTPQSLMTSSAITGDYAIDSLKCGFGPTSLSAESFNSENRWITGHLTALLSERARTLKELIDELGIRGITVESNLNRNPNFRRVGTVVPAIWGLDKLDYSVRHPYPAITQAEQKKEYLTSLFRTLNPNFESWEEIEWTGDPKTFSDNSNWGDEVEWEARGV